ncbi:hypothetical protein NCCP2222_39080 [Sporosarcina sp. NCCP-2222]|uniref:DUF3784 domain-containing protein n=1 Tax=Sporosarcina sp. NCCP-2222 TaxID=2935073 RepID=UPI002087DD93|nr:DUF3784 domain-containing protein [Sporosarcina sp. NCCP-2222]GKV57961.1 hypothetical protein NCCP2222_39080 [Sporosarcina sp. NCCP-2222]
MGLSLLFLSVPFLIFAIVLSCGKGAALLAGYNTMSEEERASYDEPALCRFMGKIMYGVCFCIIMMGVSDMLDSQVFLIVGVILLFLLIIFAVLFTNTGNRFRITT